MWIDNYSTAIYTYTGTANEAGELAWTGEYAEPVSGQWIESRTEMKYVSPDEIVETYYEKRDEGEEFKTMETVYKRRTEAE